MAQWIAIKARVECPECGSPVMLNGPWRTMRCAACLQETEVDVLWPELIKRADEFGASGTAFTIRNMRVTTWPTPNIYFAVNAGSPPICSTCDRVLPEAEAIPDGTTGVLPCSGCGASHPTSPGPTYEGKPTQVFMAEPEPTTAAAPATASTPAARPVVFGCPNCGASLAVVQASPRLLSCTYCQVDVFLPQEVWNQLHPVKKRQAFWVRR